MTNSRSNEQSTHTIESFWSFLGGAQFSLSDMRVTRVKGGLYVSVLWFTLFLFSNFY